MTDEYAIGDWVEIICHDGARFSGVLQDFNPDYLLLNGYGFPCSDIRLMSHT